MQKKCEDKTELFESTPIRQVARTLIFVMAGTVAFKRKQIDEYLFLHSQFVFIDFSQAVVFAILDYLFIIILFMIIGYYITRILNDYVHYL